jgi:1,4-dihydroxy-2-naphthoyl-CoA hydrolase
VAGPDLYQLIAYEDSFDALYGLEMADSEPEADGTLRGRLLVRPELLGAEGVMHGGVAAAVAESLASVGTAIAVAADGLLVSGMSNDTTVITPVAAGTALHATATPRGRGADLWVWSVELRDDSDALRAFSRVTIAVRPPRRT